MNKPENPPAFPHIIVEGHPHYCAGLTMRDWFAGQALAGLLASGPHDCSPHEIAHDAYKYALAMLDIRPNAEGE